MKKETLSDRQSTPIMAWLIIGFAGLGGILYGYDIGVISGALIFMKKEIQLTPREISLIVAAVLGGGSIATLVAGPLADWLGRKKMITASAVIFAIGVFGVVSSHHYPGILTGRLIQGVGVGIITIIIPLYLAEAAPARLRGRSVTVFQLFLTGGILLAYVVDLLLGHSGDWRAMFLFALIPGALLFIGSLILPESPCWLFLRGRREKALRAMLRTRSRSEAERELNEMETLQKERRPDGKRESLRKRYILLPMAIALAIACLNQLSGINVILQYSTILIKDTGLQSNMLAMLGSTGIGLINFVMTVIALFLIDRVGRKPLLTIGTGGVVVALLLAGAVEFFMPMGIGKGYALIGSLILYILFFAIGPGVVVWLALSEILPTRIRGKWMAFCLFANSMVSTLLASLFGDLIHLIGAGGVFWMCGGFTVLYFLVAVFLLPETKNRSLEEIEEHFRKENIPATVPGGELT